MTTILIGALVALLVIVGGVMSWLAWAYDHAPIGREIPYVGFVPTTGDDMRDE